MLGRILSLFIVAGLTAAMAAGADLGAGTKAEEMNVPAVVMFLIFVAATLGITYCAAKKTKTLRFKKFYKYCAPESTIKNPPRIRRRSHRGQTAGRIGRVK